MSENPTYSFWIRCGSVARVHQRPPLNWVHDPQLGKKITPLRDLKNSGEMERSPRFNCKLPPRPQKKSGPRHQGKRLSVCPAPALPQGN